MVRVSWWAELTMQDIIRKTIRSLACMSAVCVSIVLEDLLEGPGGKVEGAPFCGEFVAVNF